MHSQTKFWLLIALLVATSWAPSAARGVAETGQGPKMASIGPLTFGPDGTLFVADPWQPRAPRIELGRPTGDDAVRLWDLVLGWREFPHLYELQRPKRPDDIALIAETFRPYLEARDWVTIQNETP